MWVSVYHLEVEYETEVVWTREGKRQALGRVFCMEVEGRRRKTQRDVDDVSR